MTSSTPPRRRGRPPRFSPEAPKPVNKLVVKSLDRFLGPAPLLEGEDKAEYTGLLSEVQRQVMPEDAIEQIYVRDIVDLTWELMRSRRIKVALLHKGQIRAVQQLLSSENWPGLHSDAKSSVRTAIKTSFADGVKVFARYGVTLQDINGHAFAAERDTLLLLDQSMLKIEARRNFALREIERRRVTLGRRLGAAINEVEAEFKEVQIEGTHSSTKDT